MNFAEEVGLANTRVFALLEDLTNFTTKGGLVHNSVYTIARDASERIWFGTQGGICSYDGKTFTNFSASASPGK